MIEEAYVSFETAKLLKEKGFDELCNKKYDGYKRIVPAGKMIELWQNSELDDECSAPTQQMAMRWLREVHNIHILLEPTNWPQFGYWSKVLYYISDRNDFVKDKFVERKKTYEDAVEAAIKYCLENLI